MKSKPRRAVQWEVVDSDRPRVYRNENNHDGDNYVFDPIYRAPPLACVSLRSTCVRSPLSDRSNRVGDFNRKSGKCIDPLSLYLSSFFLFIVFNLLSHTSGREHCSLCISNKTIITSARSVCARTSTFERRPFSLLPMNACDIANPRVDQCKQTITRQRMVIARAKSQRGARSDALLQLCAIRASDDGIRLRSTEKSERGNEKFVAKASCRGEEV